ncbi:MAG: glycosyltransferase family 4 protein [Abditibacteriales bacterium]|nr:glycosyltransferase family 4 protein [Abditibacteriales bacterium]MDW8366968.1 glycosyltransferase [Abditibacteriales bacterium]
MTLLWLSEIFPYPPNSGLKVWMMNLLRPLSQWHDITLITASEEGEPPESVEYMKQFCCDVRVVVCRPEDARPDSVRDGVAGGHVPHAVRQFAFPALYEAIRAARAGRRFDAMVIETVKLAQYLPNGFEGVSVLNEHDVEALRYRSTIAGKRGLRSKVWCYQEYRRWRRYEAAAVARFDVCVALAERDGAILKRWAPTANIHYVPIPVDTAESAPFLNAPKEENLISFTGALNYYPNVDAVLYFCREVFPLIRQKVPDVKLHIIGRQPPPEVMDLCADRSVSLLPNVPDVKPHLARSVVSVAPVRLGGGTKVKIQTAMALGLPVVTTPHGIEGLQAQNGREVLVGRNAREFAAHVVRLLQDPALRQSISAAALRCIQTHYAMDVVSRQMHNLLTAALEEKRRHVSTLAR